MTFKHRFFNKPDEKLGKELLSVHFLVQPWCRLFLAPVRHHFKTPTVYSSMWRKFSTKAHHPVKSIFCWFLSLTMSAFYTCLDVCILHISWRLHSTLILTSAFHTYPNVCNPCISQCLHSTHIPISAFCTYPVSAFHGYPSGYILCIPPTFQCLHSIHSKGWTLRFIILEEVLTSSSSQPCIVVYIYLYRHRNKSIVDMFQFDASLNSLLLFALLTLEVRRQAWYVCHRHNNANVSCKTGMW